MDTSAAKTVPKFDRGASRTSVTADGSVSNPSDPKPVSSGRDIRDCVGVGSDIEGGWRSLVDNLGEGCDDFR
jgi:hypothetical protein